MAEYIGAVLAIGALVFVAVQTRLQHITTELTLNFDIVKRLDDTLLAIAEDPAASSYVWSPTVGTLARNDKPHALLQSLIDPLEMAFSATGRLYVLKKSRKDWHAYADYLIKHSAAFRKEIETHNAWYPKLAAFVARRRP